MLRVAALRVESGGLRFGDSWVCKMALRSGLRFAVWGLGVGFRV